MSIGIFYLGLLSVGVVYALLATALGWFSDLAGGDIHTDAGGHLDAGHPSPLSGTVIATFITGVGGGGSVAHYLLEWGTVPGILAATVSGLLLAGAAFLVLDLLFSKTQGGAEFATSELTGREAEVITAIPRDGVGEIAYVVRGQRESSAARSVDGAPIAKGRTVTIDRMTGPTAYVRIKE
jgi:Na+(H+)/acetate symporter ActP